jgi:hypothetical protein
MSKKSIKSLDEGLFDWWKKFLEKDREIRKELQKRTKEVDKAYALKKINQAEEDWKRMLSKKEKDWRDKFLISYTGIFDEKSLNAALKKSRKDIDSVLDNQEKVKFFKLLLQMIGTLG